MQNLITQQNIAFKTFKNRTEIILKKIITYYALYWFLLKLKPYDFFYDKN